MSVPFDNFAALERDWGIPREQWTLDQWREAAELVQRVLQVYQRTAYRTAKRAEAAEQRLQEFLPKKRGRKKASARNSLPGLPGRPRRITRQIDAEFLASVDSAWTRLRETQPQATRKDAITLMCRESGTRTGELKKTVKTLQERYSKAKARLAATRR